MPVQIECPRCKVRLSVGERKAGGYANCPRCGARLWVPAAADADVLDAAAPALQRRSIALAAASQGNGRPVKTARFISAASAPATLKLADDGALPELLLRESSGSSTGRQRGGNRLLLVGLPILSAVATAVLLLVPLGPGQPVQGTASERAWAAIQKEYFAEIDGLPHYPYQHCLRQAQRAHLRGDLRQERDLYRQVLNMLRAERKPAKGVTGSPGRDQALERHLTILLSSEKFGARQ